LIPIVALLAVFGMPVAIVWTVFHFRLRSRELDLEEGKAPKQLQAAQKERKQLEERVENLESIAEDFDGVDKAYAIQAGRELRILVNNEKITDDAAKDLAKNIAKRIESELKYPGRIKVTIIREMRVIEYAR
jgi:HD superfamily phosphodiesterase